MKINTRTASAEDIDQIFTLIKFYADQELILEREKEDIADNLDKFFIAALDNEIVGIISFHDYDAALKEIRSLSVKNNLKKKGIGSILLKTLIEFLLKRFPEARIFVLTYSPEFFKKNGFFEVNKDTLPEKIWKDCKNCWYQDDCGETALILSKNR